MKDYKAELMNNIWELIDANQQSETIEHQIKYGTTPNVRRTAHAIKPITDQNTRQAYKNLKKTIDKIGGEIVL